MFYEPDKGDHGLKYNPFKSIAVPRPIGWISTLGLNGVVNLAPYSQFQNIGFDPPYVMFSSSSRLGDSATNAQDTSEFVCNMATYDLREQVNITAQKAPRDVSEADLAGLEMVPSRIVKPPRVAASPVHMECRFQCAVTLPGARPGSNDVVIIGRVVGIHVKDEFITPDGRIDIAKIRPLARLGYMDYTSVTDIFTMPPVGTGKDGLSFGLEGRPGRERVK